MSKKIAVIDIGSNSVRLVVYHALVRTPLPLFNEKVLCGLARDMEKTGKLSKVGRKSAFAALGRFAFLIKMMNINQVKVIATSAVRDASDGKKFIKQVKKEFGFKIKVIPGKEEARLAAMGVVASMDRLDGVVGDMGGGSLELVQVYYDRKRTYDDYSKIIRRHESYPIGALRLQTLAGKDKVKRQEIIDEHLLKFQLDKKLDGKDFYAVGGGFRALGKVHIYHNKYPLGVLHHYAVPAEEMREMVEKIANMRVKYLKKLEQISSARIDTIAHTAAVMERIILHGKPARVVISAHGLREGVLFDNLSHADKKKDALLEIVKDMIKHLSPDGDVDWVTFGQELHDWMSPMFRTETDSIVRLRLAACVLSRLAWHEHVNYRAEMAYRWILDAELPSLDHSERVFVATCVYHRYMTEADSDVTEPSIALLDRDLAYRARVIGVAMRLGYQISGGAVGVLKHTPLVLNAQDQLVLSAKDKANILLNEAAERRLSILGELTKLHVKMVA